MMRRRWCLGAIAVSFGVPLARGLAQVSGDAPPVFASTTVLAEAQRRALRERRSLVILVIPDDATERRRRGGALGLFLLHGDTALRERVAEAELVAASMSSVRALYPQAPATEPWILVAHPESPATLVPVDVTIPPRPATSCTRRGCDTTREAALDGELAAVGRAFDGALRPLRDPSTSSARLTELLREPIDGAAWATTEGCGVTVERVPAASDMFECGQGAVTTRERRFLTWLVPTAP